MQKLNIKLIGGELFGYEVLQTDWTYERFLEHVVPEERDAVDSQFRAAVSQKAALPFVCRIRRTDGEIRWLQVNGEYQPPQDGGAPQYYGIVRDITEAKALEQSLRRELALREQLQQTSENVPGVMYTFRLDPDGRMAMPYVSSKLLDLTGYPPAAVTEDAGPLLALIHPDDAERIRASIEASAQALTIWHETWRINHPARDIVWIEGISSPSRGDDGSLYWHGFFSDITERKALDTALQEAGQRYVNLLRATKDAFCLVEAGSGRLLDVNAAAVSLSGYTREELLALRVTDLDIDFQGEKYIAQIDRIRRDGWGLFESRIRHKDGRILPVEVSVIPEAGDHKIVAFIRDISERRRAEQALLDSNDRYEELVRRIPAGVYTLRLHAGRPRFEYLSSKLLQMLDLEEDDAWQDPEVVFAGMHPLDRPGFEAVNQRAMEGLAPYRWEGRHQVRGETRWFRVASDPAQGADGDYRWNGVVIDISEQKRAEQALRDSELRWKFAIEGSGDGLWDLDVATGLCFYSRRWKAMIGHAEDEIGTSLEEWTRRVHPEDWSYVQANWQAHLDGTLPQHVVEYRLRHKDGSWVWILGRGQVCERDAAGQPLRVIGTHTDITARKELETRLQENELRFRMLADTSPLAIFLYTGPEQRCEYLNPRFTQLFGYTREELTTVADWWPRAYPNLGYRTMIAETWHSRVAKAIATGEPIEPMDTVVTCKDGSRKHIEWGFIAVGDEQWAFGLDMSERKAAEQAVIELNADLEQKVAERTAELVQKTHELARLSERLGLAMQVTSDGLWDCNLRTGKVYCNANYFAMLGYGPDELGDNLADVMTNLLPPEEREALIDSIRQRFTTEGGHVSEFRMRTKAGGYRWILARGRVIERDAEGQPVRAIGTHIDITARKEADAALRALSNYSRRLIETSLDPLVTISPEGLIQDVNTATERVTGYSREQLIGSDFSSYFTEPEQARAGYEQVFAEGFVTDYPLAIRHADGHVTDVLYNASVYRNDAGEVAGVFAAARDVTQRKQAEAALRALSNYSRRLIETSLDPLVTISPEGRILDVNSATEQVTGCTREQLIGSDFSSYFTEPDQARAGYEQVFAEGFVTDYPLAIRHADGHVTDVLYNASVYRNDAGEVAGVFAAARDVTQRKQAEAALRALSNYSRRLIETSLDPLVTISPEGRILDVNSATEQVTGCTREQLIGSDFSSYFTAPEQARAGYQQVFAEGYVTDYPLAIRHADGHVTDVLYNASVYRNDAGEVAGVFAAARDVTERKRAEAAVRELNASLERKVVERTAQLAEAKAAAEAAARSKSEFLANMSHEIRTPMNAILGLTQLLEREPLTPDQRDMLGKIGDAGNGLLYIINDILDFSKIEAGQLTVERLPFDLPSVLSLLETLLTGSAEGKGLRLQIEPPTGLTGALLGDPLRLKQILLNLVSNAIKFTDRGAVTVRVLPLALTETAVRLRFEVSDTGIGIGPEALAKLFQPFTQADASTTRRFGGTGLGLSICKRLVELMGGTIGATSEPGKGSTFWFELPCERAASAAVVAGADAASVADDSVAAKAGPRLPGLRVLAVDDNRINLFMLERALQLEGARVHLAADGQQALQTLAADPRGFDCVLMDVQMPVMDGLTATRLIREQAELRNLPVIALTAGVMAEERERALAAGVDDFLAKPLVLETLVAMLRPYLPAGGGAGGGSN